MSISHSFHCEHELSLVTTGAAQFICDGCNQFGQGPGHYHCEPCNFDLHAHCAIPALLDVEGFILLQNQTNQNGHMTCYTCGGETVGFRYFNKEVNLYYHPCCLFLLPSRVVQDGRVFERCHDASRECGICGQNSQPSSYRTSYDDGEVYLHVSCLVRSHNTLTGVQNWQPGAPIIQDVLGSLNRKTNSTSSGNGNGRAALRTVGHGLMVGLHVGVKVVKVGFHLGMLGVHVATLNPAGIAESAAGLFQ